MKKETGTHFTIFSKTTFMMKYSTRGAVTSPANQGDTSGPGGESKGQQPSSAGGSCDDAAKADGRAQLKDKMNLRTCRRIGTWNVRTMSDIDPSKLHILEREMERYNIPICGLAEVRWTEKGISLQRTVILSTTLAQTRYGGME